MKKLTALMLIAASFAASASLAFEDRKETFSTTISDSLGKGDIYGEIVTTVKHTKEDYLVNKRMKIVRRDASGKEIWKVQDFIEDCPVDTTLQILKPVSLTDLNDNGLKEVWMVYKLACRGDITPADMKIIMYEGKTKHAVRGSMKPPRDAEGEILPNDGAHNADENMKKAHSDVREHAEYIWRSYEEENFTD